MDSPVLPEWLVLPVFKAHRVQEACRVFVGIQVLMVFPVVMVKTEQRVTREIADQKAHRVLWVQEVFRGSKAHKDPKENKAQLVLMESRDQEGLKAMLDHKDRKENKVYPVKRENKAQKVQSAHRDYKESRVLLVQWDHGDNKAQRVHKAHKVPKENKDHKAKTESPKLFIL